MANSKDDIFIPLHSAYVYELTRFLGSTPMPTEEEHRGTRLYANSPDTIALQIRCSNQLANCKLGQRRMIAHASLNAAEIKALHKALTTLMKTRGIKP